jgi:catechol 2,3-dioxygenase-like lactoylglutathione lyase family enzyme
MNISHISLLSLPVADQDRAKEFYVNKLDFKVIRDIPMGPDQRWVQIALENAQTSIALVTWFDSMKSGSSKGLVLETTDLDSDVAALREAGIELEGNDIQEQPWGRFVTFTDPDGNGIILQSTSPNI